MEVSHSSGSFHKPLTIAFCLPEFEPQDTVKNGKLDAATLQQTYISAGLQARNHRLTFLSPWQHHEMVCTDNLPDIKLAPRSWTRSRLFNLSSSLTWQVQKRLGIPYLNVFSNYRYFDACMHCLPGHDIVYERNSLYTHGVAMASKRLGIPYVVFFDADQIMELDYLGTPITGLLKQRAVHILRYNLRVSDCVICVSEQSKVRLEKVWDVPASKVAVFPNAVDVERFAPSQATRVAVRSKLGLGSRPAIVFVGNFYKWHDVCTLLKAFARVQGKYPDANLLLVGDGPELQTMVKFANELNINKSVLFSGLVSHEEIPGLISASDIAVAPVPHLTDNLWLSPMKLFEYMASGIAILATASGQVSEVIQDSENGLLVPPGDVDSMASCLEQLISAPDLRMRLGARARQDAVSKHSWEQYINRLERLLLGIVSARIVQ